MSNYKNVMLVSPDEVKAQSDVNYNVDDTAIGASIRVAQNIYLRDIIGTDFLEKLQELVWNEISGAEDKISDEANVAYKTLLDDYIGDVIIYKVAYELCSRLTYKLRNIALVQNSDTNANASQLADVIYMKEVYDTYFNDATNRMVEFICKNKDAYPEAEFACGCGKNPLYGRTGLWLG